MCSVKTWSTEEDVMRDLVMTSGRRIARMGNLDKGCFVVGNAPPPHVSEVDDDEIRLQFGDDIDTSRDGSGENAPPDLQGIKNLLKMVQVSDEEDNEVTIPTGQRSKCVISISKASVLNPNVKEFKPKGSSDISESSPNIKTENNKLDADSKDSATPNYSEDVPIVEPNHSEADPIVEPTHSEDVPLVEAITTLKNKITSKPDSFEKKKQNNVAIASLLRIHCKKPTEIKLITPDYYENTNRPQSAQATLEVTPPQTTLSTPESKSALSIGPSCSSNDVQSEPVIPTEKMVKIPNTSKLDPAIKKSIEKVNNWFGEPPERKSPAICLGPIAFKKKEPAAPQSPSTTETDAKTSKSQIKQFKPSGYAADLEKKYMERSTVKEKLKKNMWTNLDEILKEKDKMLSEKQLSKAQNNDGPGPNDSILSPAAPKSPSTTETDAKTSKSQIKQFKPSGYAADLGKKYMEKSKVKDKKVKKNMWTNLDEILKEKDKMLREKQLAKAQNNNGPGPNDEDRQ